MLIRFEVANFRSILDPVELSLVAVDRARPAARSMPGIGESLLPLAAVYGPNASGKSNLLAALDWLRVAVADSLRFWEDGIPIEPFLLATDGERSAEFAIEFAVSGVRFEYRVELDRTKIYYEALFHYPKGSRRRIFEREGLNLKLQRGLGAVSGARDLLTDRTLALSASRRFDEPLISRFAFALFSMQFLGVRPLHRVRPSARRSTASLFDEDQDVSSLSSISSVQGEQSRSQALAMIRMADLGVEDVEIVDDEVTSGERTHMGRRVRLIHRAGNDRRPLEMDDESRGTQTWFELIGPILQALTTGSPVVFDELDNSLHPALSSQLLRFFSDRETNPRGAQLIFASHDTSLLDHLNRDEVWLTEKMSSGATQLAALAEFSGPRVRKSENLEQGYLRGRFGGVPDVDRVEMLRAMGLIG